MRLVALPGVSFEDEGDLIDEVECLVADRLTAKYGKAPEVEHTVQHSEEELELLRTLRTKLLEEFEGTFLSGIYPKDPPVRGPFGGAEIWLKPDARPVSVTPYQIHGERRMALDKLIGEAMDHHKMEKGQGPWNTPVFPVPKKEQGSYRDPSDQRVACRYRRKVITLVCFFRLQPLSCRYGAKAAREGYFYFFVEMQPAASLLSFSRLTDNIV